MIYFDASATTFQKPPAVRRAVLHAMECCASPGRGGYSRAAMADELLFRTRQAAAALFDCQPEQVVFTMNATHGLNVAIKSLAGSGDRVVISGFEHNAVLRPLHALGAELVIAGRQLFDREAVLSAFERAVTPDTAAVVCTHVSNVFGFILPIEEIAALCAARHVPLIVDASQSAGTIPLSLSGLGAAFIAMPGHKGLYGPPGTGLLLCAQPGQPLLEGGTGTASMERTMPEELPERLEAGTANVWGIAGLLAGLHFVQDSGEEEILAHEQSLRCRLTNRLEGMDAVQLYTGAAQTGVLSLRLRDVDSEDAARMLGCRGIAVRAGLHCAPLAHESAGTLPGGTLRVSFSAFNSPREVDCFARELGRIIRL